MVAVTPHPPTPTPTPTPPHTLTHPTHTHPSLTTNHCSLSMEDIDWLLSQTPSVIDLKSISCNRTYDKIFDGYSWKVCIVRNLLCLKRFEYLFSFTDPTKNYMIILNSIIDSFQTSFWLYEKKWFTICGYIFESKTFELRTSTVKSNGSDNSIKYEKLARSGAYPFIQVPKRVHEKRVCVFTSVT
jgi:hypothetical protein